MESIRAIDLTGSKYPGTARTSEGLAYCKFGPRPVCMPCHASLIMSRLNTTKSVVSIDRSEGRAVDKAEDPAGIIINQSRRCGYDLTAPQACGLYQHYKHYNDCTTIEHRLVLITGNNILKQFHNPHPLSNKKPTSILPTTHPPATRAYTCKINTPFRLFPSITRYLQKTPSAPTVNKAPRTIKQSALVSEEENHNGTGNILTHKRIPLMPYPAW